MNRMRSLITGKSIADSLRLKRASTQDPFVLVEGVADQRFYSKFLNENVRFHPCTGKENTVQAIELLKDYNCKGCLSIVDKDQDDLLGISVANDNLVKTDFNDLECMLFFSSAADTVLTVLGSVSKIKKIEHEKNQKVTELIAMEASKIGVLRFISRRDGCCANFKNIKYVFHPKKNDFYICITQQIERVNNNTRNKDKFDTKDMRDKAQVLLNSCEDYKVYSCKDDVLAVAGKALKHQIGSDGIFDSLDGRERLLKYFILAFHKENFENTAMYRAIKKWEKATGYIILR